MLCREDGFNPPQSLILRLEKLDPNRHFSDACSHQSEPGKDSDCWAWYRQSLRAQRACQCVNSELSLVSQAGQMARLAKALAKQA